MCGIAGTVSLSGAPIEDLSRRVSVMRKLIEHRGPDGSGQWLHSKANVGLGHQRLTIIDLTESGAQPMSDLFFINNTVVNDRMNGGTFLNTDASVTTALGIHVARRSDSRYQAFASAFHFFRCRSRPSTFSATGMPRARGIQVNTALAALQYSTAS